MDPPASSLQEGLPSREVSWQAAWWALVPLAIGAMTQPCGHILGYRERNFRFYIRASPILCIADVIHFIGLVLLGSSLNPRTFLRNIKYELNLRFSGDSAESDLRHAASTRFMRIVLLGLTGIPCQTVKLASMTGIPWTKTWALMFLISIVFGELLNLIIKPNRLSSSIGLTPPSWRGHSAFSVLSRFSKGNTLFIPMSIHCGVAVTAIFSVMWHFSIKITDPFASRHPFSSTIASFVLTSAPTGATILLASCMVAKPLNWWRWKFALYLVVCECVFISTVLHFLPWHRSWNELITYNMQFASYTSYLFTTYVNADRPPIVTFGFMSILGKLVYSGFIHLTVMVLGILLTFLMPIAILRNGTLSKIFNVDTMECANAVVVFLTTFLFSLIYYSHLYFADETSNPLWIGVFG